MKLMLKKLGILVGLALCLGLIISLRSEPMVNWLTATKLMAENDAQKRIILLNTTLAYDPEYWNPRYLQCALRADSSIERTAIAGILKDRFGTNGRTRLQEVIADVTSDSAKANAEDVMSKLDMLLQ